MAYKQGVALGASVALLIGSIALLATYAACSGISCKGIPISIGSPIWTGVIVLATSFIGIYMSATKSENGCGGCFLFLSIVCIIATAACVLITLIASFAELIAFSTSDYIVSRTPTTTQATPFIDPIIPYILWLVMMCVAFILFIVTWVTSCQYSCCCQEQEPRQQTIIVYQGGESLPQNIVLENNTIVTPLAAAPQMVVLGGLHPGTQSVQQPFHGQQIFTQPMAPQGSRPQGAPPPYTPHPTAPYNFQSAQMGPAQQTLQPTAPSISQSSLVNRPPQQSAATWNQTPNHPQPPTVNQSRPVLTGNSQSPPGYSTRINDTGPAPPAYQPLIHDSTNLGANPGANPGTQHTVHRAPNTDPTDDEDYLTPNREGNAAAGDLNSRLYEYIEDPSYDYADTQVERGIITSNANTEYINENIGTRPQAPTPTN